MADSLQILNAIRDVAGAEYQARIPQATRTNIANVGNTILSYSPSANAFFTGLLNRIGKVVIDRMDGMEDIYDVFENGKLEFGDTIQKIFVDIPSANAFDGTAVNKIFKALRLSGAKDVSMFLYKDCRHEILNDTCKNETAQDILDFIGE